MEASGDRVVQSAGNSRPDEEAHPARVRIRRIGYADRLYDFEQPS